MAFIRYSARLMTVAGAMLVASAASGQLADGTLYLELARSLRKELPNGLILVDPNVWAPGNRDRPLTSAARAALLEGFGAETAKFEDVISCPGKPETCRLVRGQAVVAVGEPEMSRDTAKVRVHYATMLGGSDTPVARTDLLMVLVRRSGQKWQMVERILLRIT